MMPLSHPVTTGENRLTFFAGGRGRPYYRGGREHRGQHERIDVPKSWRVGEKVDHRKKKCDRYRRSKKDQWIPLHMAPEYMPVQDNVHRFAKRSRRAHRYKPYRRGQKLGPRPAHVHYEPYQPTQPMLQYQYTYYQGNNAPYQAYGNNFTRYRPPYGQLGQPRYQPNYNGYAQSYPQGYYFPNQQPYPGYNARYGGGYGRGLGHYGYPRYNYGGGYGYPRYRGGYAPRFYSNSYNNSSRRSYRYREYEWYRRRYPSYPYYYGRT